MGCCCSSTEADTEADARVKWAEEQPGQSLSQYSSTTRLTREKAPTRPDINLIAQAAEKRTAQSKPHETNLTPMQKFIRAQAKKELEEERQRRLAQEMDQMKANENRQQQQLPKKREDDKVLYTCELFDDNIALPKSKMMGAIEECLFERLKDSEADQLTTSICIIYTLNKEEPRKGAIEIIQRYLQNIVNDPKEPKFKQIKLSNRVFQEKVAPCKGTMEFLKAVGFRREQIDNEEYLVIHDDTAGNINYCEKMVKLLMDGEPAKIRVHRDPKVFRIDPTRKISPQPEIPAEFYMVTVDDIRKEQQRHTEALEKTLTLRTQKTRDLEEARKKLPIYKYTYIRIRFPDNYILQGIFNVFEKLSAVREFTSKHLAIDNGIFSLTNSAFTNGNGGMSDDERTLTSLGLVPTAILYFSWDSDTMTKFQKECVQAIPYLSEEMQKSAENLN